MKQEKQDHCTWFPEYWLKYKCRGFKKLPFKKVYIGHLCKEHDKECSSHTFFSLLWNERIVCAVAIATVASFACWLKYTTKMRKRV